MVHVPPVRFLKTKLRWARLTVCVGLALTGLMPGAAASALVVCATPLQQLVDATPPGGVLQLPACIYEQSITINKPMTLDGQGHAEIRGSDVWSDWTPSGGLWISDQTLPVMNNGSDALCYDPRCGWPEQAFFDSTALVQVAADTLPASGQFSVNANRQIVLADNPDGHVIEISTRSVWISTASDNVTIEGLTMRHAANAAQIGAVGNQGFDGWTLQNNKLYDSHGAAVVVGGGTASGAPARVLQNTIAESGFQGILVNATANTQIRENEVYWNNTEGFLLDWSGGGIKLVGAVNAVADANIVHDNQGPGLWCDQACDNVTFSNNRVYWNAGRRPSAPDGTPSPDGSPQVFFEISDGAQIWGNTVWGTTGAWPAIYISSAADAEVYNNVVAWSDRGIQAYLQTRDSVPNQGQTNVYFHDNAVLMGRAGGLAIMWGDYGSNQITTASNHAARNSIWFPSPENGQARFQWGSQQFTSLAPFSLTPGGGSTDYLTAAQALQILDRYAIPVPGNVGLPEDSSRAGATPITSPAAAPSARLD